MAQFLMVAQRKVDDASTSGKAAQLNLYGSCIGTSSAGSGRRRYTAGNLSPALRATFFDSSVLCMISGSTGSAFYRATRPCEQEAHYAIPDDSQQMGAERVIKQAVDRPRPPDAPRGRRLRWYHRRTDV